MYASCYGLDYTDCLLVRSGPCWQAKVNFVTCDSNGHVTVSVAWYTYIYITGTKSRADWLLWLSISDNLYTCLMSHSFYINKPLKFIPLLHNSGGRYNLWSYTFESFLKFLITFSHKILKTNQHCSQTQSTVYSQYNRPSVTPTSIKILHKHTHIYISTNILSENRKESKTFWRCSQHYCKSISFDLLDSAIFIL
jgi:hypothetical protein